MLVASVAMLPPSDLCLWIVGLFLECAFRTFTFVLSGLVALVKSFFFVLKIDALLGLIFFTGFVLFMDSDFM